MSVHVSGRKRHPLRPGQQTLAALLTVVALVAPAWSWAVITAHADARQSVALVVGTASLALCAAVAVAVHQTGVARAARARGTRADTAAETLEHEVVRLADQLLPALVEAVRQGRPAHDAIAEHPLPRHVALHQLAHTVGTVLDAAEARATRDRARRAELEEQVTDLDRAGLPLMVTRIHGDRVGTAEALQSELPPVHDTLTRLRGHVLDELLAGGRRSTSAMEAAAASGARIQANLTSLLAKLRELQDRYGDRPDVFGDLLDIDHGVSRAGRLADGFVVLAGGRSGRDWTRPIAMESILRGAMGRISDYRRIRLHSTSAAAVIGYAAEGVMQALAELMDNAANFSAHGTEVHVYVQEEDPGLAITVEDSGLGMRLRERRLAEGLVTYPRDLSTLCGSRMGLAVVGRLADKYGLGVSFRPSAHGGTSAVVLVPPHLVTGSQHSRTRKASGLPRRRRGQSLTAALREEPRRLSPARTQEPIGHGTNTGARFAAFRDASCGTEGIPLPGEAR